MQGLDDTMILLLTKWRCRYCDNPEEKFAGRGNCGIDSTVENQFVKMTASITTAITKAVKESVKEEQVAIAVGEANGKVAKSWADLAKGAQKELIHNVVKESSKVALSESIQLVDANLTEQRKRSRNIVISGIIEKSNENKDLRTDVCKLLGDDITERDILNKRIVSIKE